MLGDLNIHAETMRDKPVQYFLATMTTLDLLQVISGPIHQGGHTLDLMICADWNDLTVDETVIKTLLWIDHYMVICRIAE